MPNELPHDGLLLFAHGARDPLWAEPFEAVAAQVRAASPGLHVALSYLEFMSPSLPEGISALAAQGCRRVLVLPMFLGAGGHVRRDLPELLHAASQAHPGLALHLSSAIGEQPAVLAAMSQTACLLCGHSDHAGTAALSGHDPGGA
jgi:sirohydrochlorin cobaltochelatase